MIDREARTKLAELIRHLVAGMITNDEFDDRRPNSTELAIREVFIGAHGISIAIFGEHLLKPGIAFQLKMPDPLFSL